MLKFVAKVAAAVTFFASAEVSAEERKLGTMVGVPDETFPDSHSMASLEE